MKKQRLLLPCFLAALAVLTASGPTPAGPGPCSEPVATAQGPVIGKAEPGAAACAYQGIPYAAPPVGELRWSAPAPALARDQVLAADRFGSQCLQPGFETHLDLGFYRIVGSEDCLFLNIWRPMKSGSFPVMVWIHGGDLLQGSGSTPMYWGDRLAKNHDVVVVTINYRLGPFGFLYHPALAEEDPHHSSGNYGLMDQVMALEWVRDNISAFSGDPHNVTIFGESAGGWSVCHLLASPLAAGLFHRAIIESGGCECSRSVEQGTESGLAFAARLGCAAAEAAKCLRQKAGPEIIKAMGKEWQGMLKIFFPHVDGYALNESPLKALASGRYNNVPLLAGSTRDEFKLFFNEVPGGRYLTRSRFRASSEKYLGTKLGPELESLYPFDSYSKPIDAALDAFGDAYLSCPVYRAVRASSADQPLTWYYRFDYDDMLMPELIGAAHAMELGFVFQTLDRPPSNALYPGPGRKRAEPLAQIISGYWTNFAAKRDPNGPGLPAWPAYTSQDEARLNLDLPVSSGAARMDEKCGFWARQDIIVH
jgi:para-nitrobenzyl esterase